MNIEAIEPVLQEVLGDLNTLKELKEKEHRQIEDLIQLTKSFDNKLSNMKVTALPSDLSQVEQQITKGIEGVRQVLAEQPKTITRHFHFHLFPKLNIMEYYRTYSRLALFMTIFLLAAGLVGIGVEWIQGYNLKRDQLPENRFMEKYSQPARQLEKIKTGPRPANIGTDTLNRKQLLKSKSLDKGVSKRELLLDSLNDQLEQYLYTHSIDTLKK